MFDKPTVTRALLGLLMTVSIVMLASCGGKKEQFGKFTPEEMEKFGNPIRQELPKPTGGLVLSVGESTIEASELIAPAAGAVSQTGARVSFDEFAAFARPQVAQMLRDKIADILLYEKARKTLPEQVLEEDGPLDKAVESEMQRFMARHKGNYAEAEKTIKSFGMDWKSFRQYQKRMVLVQSYFSTELKTPTSLTRRQLHDHYEKIKTERFSRKYKAVFALIDIQPAKFMDDSTTAEKAREIAMSQAANLVILAKEGKDFDGLVKEYSHGFRAATGGIWEMNSRGSLAAPYDAVEAAVEKIAPGQIAGPIESGEHIFVAKLVSRQEEGFEPFEKVENQVRLALTNEQRAGQYEELIDKLMADARISGLNEFVEFCISRAYDQAFEKMESGR